MIDPTKRFDNGVLKFHNRYADLMTKKSLRLCNDAKIWDHGFRTQRSIILLHGLYDSPAYMMDIARIFFDKGYNVIVPLLPYHGLRNPAALSNIIYADFIHEVDFAVAVACELGERVSIGGLSVGGTLALFESMIGPARITGSVYLFSPLLRMSDLKEAALPAMAAYHKNKYLLLKKLGVTNGTLYNESHFEDPYAYSHRNYVAEYEVLRLLDMLRNKYVYEENRYAGIVPPFFIAHSESDRVSSITETILLVENTQGTFYRIPKSLNVAHKDVIFDYGLKDPEGRVIHGQNPVFKEMRYALEYFIKTHD